MTIDPTIERINSQSDAWDTPPMGRIINALGRLKYSTDDRSDNFQAYRVSEKTYFVQVRRVMWSLHDNGGEITMEQVNSDSWECSRSIPITEGMRSLDLGTIVYRLGQVLKGEDVDYNHRASEEINDYL